MADPETFIAWRSGSRSVVLGPADGDSKLWAEAVAGEQRRRTVFVGPGSTLAIADGKVVAPTKADLDAVSARAGKREFRVFSPTGLDQRLAELNEGCAADLLEQLRSPLGVIPFVGAGMSAPFGFPMWDRFLRTTAERLGSRKALAKLEARDFEGAAERLDAKYPDQFTDSLRDAFDRPMDASRLREGAISYVPLLVSGPVITTNFDHLLEDAFAAAGHAFADVVAGPSDDRTVAAIHRNRHTLLKIHGTVEERRFRVFTKAEYQRSYEEGEVTLESLAWLTFTNRPLLFLGCSLEVDRTVIVLAEIHGRLPEVRHFAVLPAKCVKQDLQARAKELAALGIRPLWYPPGRYERIGEILRDLVEGAATSERVRGTAKVPAGSPNGRRFRRIVTGATGQDARAKEIAGYVVAGQVAFSLGAGSHLHTLPLGDPFYKAMADEFGAPALQGDRSAVAAFIDRRYGTQVRWDWVRRTLDQPVEPGLIHQMLVALPGLLRSLGRPEPMWVFTTNYDAVLERGLVKAREPFHLLYFMEAEGLFAHRAPDGTVRVIERPEAIRELRPAVTVIVKLNGGIVDDPPPPESVVIATGQFERLAARIPDALPGCVRTELDRRRLLLLGHGLNEPDLHEVIKTAGMPSWWISMRPADPVRHGEWDERTRQLGGYGLVTIERPLADFAAQLHAELAAGR